MEPGFKAALPVHNKKFAQYFSVEAKYFLNTDNKLEKKYLFFCHSTVEFLDAVDRERGRTGVEQVTLIQGDTGQGYTKVAVSHLDL